MRDKEMTFLTCPVCNKTENFAVTCFSNMIILSCRHGSDTKGELYAFTIHKSPEEIGLMNSPFLSYVSQMQ